VTGLTWGGSWAQIAAMSLLSMINETFPMNRAAEGGVFVSTRGGGVYAGAIKHCDDRAMVLDTPNGVVLVIPRSIVAISDKRDALEPARP
jgi:hypothetical protein